MPRPAAASSSPRTRVATSTLVSGGGAGGLLGGHRLHPRDAPVAG